jgi:hypothetical protein
LMLEDVARYGVANNEWCERGWQCFRTEGRTLLAFLRDRRNTVAISPDPYYYYVAHLKSQRHHANNAETFDEALF